MAETVFDKSSGNLDGTEETITRVTASTLDSDETLYHVYNNLDVNVDFKVTGSRAGDDDFNEGVVIKSATTINSGGNADFYVVSDPWEQVELSLTPASNPSSGSLKVHESVDN